MGLCDSWGSRTHPQFPPAPWLLPPPGLPSGAPSSSPASPRPAPPGRSVPPGPFRLLPLTFAWHLSLGLQLCSGHVVPTLSSATSPLDGTCPLGWSSLCIGCWGAHPGRGGPCPPLPQQSGWRLLERGELRKEGSRGAGAQLAAATCRRRRARGRLPCSGDRSYLR